MATQKRYGDTHGYENKLYRVMQRLGVEKYNYNWDRHSAYVEFYYKDGFYRFDHSTGKSDLRYGSDVFAQLVLALEDLARIVERNIYDLQTWVRGLKALPIGDSLPGWAQVLGFNKIFNSVEEITKEEITKAYRNLVKEHHPDRGGEKEGFLILQKAKDKLGKYEGLEIEFGVTNKTQLSLIGIGLSRPTSFAISDIIPFDSLDEMAVVSWLKDNTWMTADMPELIKAEVNKVLSIRTEVQFLSRTGNKEQPKQDEPEEQDMQEVNEELPF